jgi:excisionase family DNA binding protein
MTRDRPLTGAVPSLLEVFHVARRLSASEEFVRREIRAGRLPAVRLGARWRVDPLDLEAYIDARRVAARAARVGVPRDRSFDSADV